MKLIHESLILGSVALDTIETKYGKAENLLGGSATYATIAAGLYGDAIPVGIVGDDFPKDGLDIFEKFSKNLKDLDQQPGGTFKWGGKYHENGDDRDTLFTDLGVFENFNPSIHTSNKNASWLFLANIHPSLQLSVLEQCTNAPLVVTDTMNLWIDSTPEELKKIISKTNILLINESELHLLTKEQNVDKSIKEVLSMGPEKVIVKFGSKGAKCFSENENIAVGVYPVKKVIDPTGAGDVFGGGFISGLVDGLSIKEAMLRGSALASFCIEDFGVKKLLNVSVNEVDNRIQLIN
ncbi:MAG: PfkB family carbohydrate kinase [bacterium]|jgi:sugar/nucleoside kinase (ribokinase family)|tara:strand:+ start:810 stop:1691 length:882 start_codon:yes stop_codon:yes gene_type:complete